MRPVLRIRDVGGREIQASREAREGEGGIDRQGDGWGQNPIRQSLEASRGVEADRLREGRPERMLPGRRRSRCPPIGPGGRQTGHGGVGRGDRKAGRLGQGTPPFRPDPVHRRDGGRPGRVALRGDRGAVEVLLPERLGRIRGAGPGDPPVGQERRAALFHNQEGERVPKEIPMPGRGEHGDAQSVQRDNRILLEKEKQRPLPQGGCDGGLQEAPGVHLGNASQRDLIREIVYQTAGFFKGFSNTLFSLRLKKRKPKKRKNYLTRLILFHLCLT